MTTLCFTWQLFDVNPLFHVITLWFQPFVSPENSLMTTLCFTWQLFDVNPLFHVTTLWCQPFVSGLTVITIDDVIYTYIIKRLFPIRLHLVVFACVVVTNLTVKVWFVEQHFKVRKNLKLTFFANGLRIMSSVGSFISVGPCSASSQGLDERPRDRELLRSR